MSRRHRPRRLLAQHPPENSDSLDMSRVRDDSPEVHASGWSAAELHLRNHGCDRRGRYQMVFPTTSRGLDRATSWITHRIGDNSALVVIEGVGSYGARLAERVGDAGLLVAEPSAMPAAQRRPRTYSNMKA